MGAVLADPLRPDAAKRRIVECLSRGVVSPSKHACEEMQNDNLGIVDCINVLRAGVVEEPEQVNGTWRYRVRTAQIVVVVAFRSETHLRIVTAWRQR
jgi:hypothetical protein